MNINFFNNWLTLSEFILIDISYKLVKVEIEEDSIALTISLIGFGVVIII